MLYRAKECAIISGRMQIVLFFQSSQRNNWERKLAGAYQFAREHDWLLQVIPNATRAREMRRTIAFWKPAGCMVDMVNSHCAVPDSVFQGCPVVYLDPPRARLQTRNPILEHDSAATAKLAAEELLKSGFADYAYVPYQDNRWNRDRMESFRRVVTTAGKRFHKSASTNPRVILSRLPKPCGILAGNDAAAADTIHAATVLGLSIPGQIAIAGIDNEELLCENENPTISSVEQDFEGAGYRLAQLLAMEMERKGSAPQFSMYGPLRLVKRSSTAMFPKDDPRVRRALEYIRLKATSGKVSINDVAEAMGCSRRLATLRFREIMGRSITDEIQRVRIETAKLLLRDTWRTTDSIVDFCGYASASYLKKAFKARTGTTMREWRKRNTRLRANVSP